MSAVNGPAQQIIADFVQSRNPIASILMAFAIGSPGLTLCLLAFFGGQATREAVIPWLGGLAVSGIGLLVAAIVNHEVNATTVLKAALQNGHLEAQPPAPPEPTPPAPVVRKVIHHERGG